MTDEHKSTAEQNTRQVAAWLVENRAEFEGQGIDEDQLAATFGMMDAEVTEAVDHLENHEVVVRVPQALTTPPQFVLKAGRGWTELRDEILGRRSGGSEASRSELRIIRQFCQGPGGGAAKSPKYVKTLIHSV